MHIDTANTLNHSKIAETNQKQWKNIMEEENSQPIPEWTKGTVKKGKKAKKGRSYLSFYFFITKSYRALQMKKKQIKKKVVSHLRGDIKGYKKEIAEDKKLITKLKKREKHGEEEGCDCQRKKSHPKKRAGDAKKTGRVQRRKVQVRKK